MLLEAISHHKVNNGWLKRYKHKSESLNCEMTFSIFLPPNATSATPVPVLYWLSGLTCSDENFVQKAAAFETAAKLNMAIVCCDTSPRGENVADAPEYDLGQGAGFYINATNSPWSAHYHMYDYVVEELPLLIKNNFPVLDIKSIAGHSMGGHGAMIVGLKNSKQYASISAFSPICQPSQCPWGEKIFRAYLGENRETWKGYDTCELLKQHISSPPILVSQGTDDEFLEKQLKTKELKVAAKYHQSNIQIDMHDGYDHSYFFIASFIGEHLKFHANYMQQ